MGTSTSRRRQASTRLALAGSVLAAVWAFPAAGHASPLFELSGGVLGQGGMNARTVGPGAASAYFNPALLPEADRAVAVSFMTLTDRIHINLDPRPDALPCMSGMCSINVPTNINDAASAADGSQLPANALPTRWLNEGTDGGFDARPRQQQRDPNNTTYYAVVGLVVPIFKQWLVFGFYGMIPMGDFTLASQYFPDENEQFFSNSLHAELYEDRLRATSLAFGLGSKPDEHISFGVSATLLLENSASAPVFVPDASNLSDIQLLSDVKVRAGIAPHLGVRINPTEDWHITGTVHSPSDFVIKAGYVFTLRDGSTQSAAVQFTHDYMPWQFALGIAWDALKSASDDVTVVGTAEYALWSNYQDRAPRNLVGGVEGDIQGPKTPQAPYAWKNTVAGALGVRWRHRQVSMFADGRIQPSPVPDQTGRTNYVDNMRVGAMMGAEGDIEVAETTFRIGGTFQFHRLIPRHVTKIVPTQQQLANENVPDHLVQDALPDKAVVAGSTTPFPNAEGLQTNNPGFPGYGSSGWVFGGGINISVLF